MDVSLLFRNEAESNTLVIMVGEEPTEWHWRPLSFGEKLDCESKALTVLQSPGGGVLHVNLETYYIEALLLMIRGGPDGLPISKQSLRSLKQDIGKQLEALVPPPFAASSNDSTIKKE